MALAGLFEFVAYDRLAQLPPGAVLTLFRRRFGVEDVTAGADVRAKLDTDAALAPPEEADDFGLGQVTGLVRGVFFSKETLTPLDRAILSSFKGITLETEEPEWDDDHSFGEIRFRNPVW